MNALDALGNPLRREILMELRSAPMPVWSSGMPLGLFKGERTYQLRQAASGGVEFAMREEYTGLLAPLFTKSIPDLQPAFDEFAACLKARAEWK